MTPLLPAWQNKNKIVIGMLHLPALPGSPQARLSFSEIRDRLLRDTEMLARGGVDGLMMENFGDVPFFPGRVPAHVVAAMTALACEVRRAADLPLGINVLRNDGRSALAIAVSSNAAFIRVNVLCGARVTDQGLIQGIAHDLLRDRTLLKADAVKIMADVDVKHSTALAERPLEDEVDDLVHRAMADAIVVSGAGTGKKTDPEKAHRVKATAPTTPVFIGSGITPETVTSFSDCADGFIIGTALKVAGIAANAVEAERVRRLMDAIRK